MFKLESITIKEFFKKHNIPFNEVSPRDLDIKCPFCGIDNLQINPAGKGYCRSCDVDMEFQEIIEALGFKYRIESVDNGVIKFVIDDNNEERYLSKSKEFSYSEIKIDVEKKFEPITLKILYQMDFPEVQWLVEGLVPLAGMTAISGIPGSYKCWLVEHIAINVAGKTDFLGHFKTLQSKVLLIDEENNLALLRSRLKQLNDDQLLPIYILSQNNIKIDKEKDLKGLMNLVKEQNIKLVIFDSLVRIHSQDENTATGMAQVFEALKSFTKEGVTVIFTHHHRKTSAFAKNDSSQNLRGSSDILAAVDCHLAIDKKEDFIVIYQNKLRQRMEMKPFKVTIKSENDKFQLEYIGEHDEIEIKKREIKENIVELLSNTAEEFNLGKLREKIESSDKLLRDALKELINSGEIVCITRAHNEKFYSKRADIDVSQE